MIYNCSARCLIAYGPLLSRWYVWVRLFFPVLEKSHCPHGRQDPRPGLCSSLEIMHSNSAGDGSEEKEEEIKYICCSATEFFCCPLSGTLWLGFGQKKAYTIARDTWVISDFDLNRGSFGSQNNIISRRIADCCHAAISCRTQYIYRGPIPSPF